MTYSATASDLVSSGVPTCNPASSSLIPIGKVQVACTVADAVGNTISRSFQVTVKGAAEQIVDLIALLRGAKRVTTTRRMSTVARQREGGLVMLKRSRIAPTLPVRSCRP